MINQSFSEGLYCSNCFIKLEEDETKEHYKSEFHRYNIKRRLANLKPLTMAAYQEKKDKLMN